MNEFAKKFKEAVDKNPFLAGYAVGATAGVLAMTIAMRGGQKMLILRMQTSQKNL